MLSRNPMHKKLSQGSNSQSCHTYKAVNLKSNPQKQNKDIPKVSPFMVKAEFMNTKTENAVRLDHKRPPWMETIHKQLLKSVVLPPQNQDSAEFKQKPVHSCSTGDLISMVWNIPYVNKESMKIMAAIWQRFDSMTLEEILTVADVFFQKNVHVPLYASGMITYIDEQFGSLLITPLQLTRLVFHISNHGSAPQSLLHSIEMKLSDNLSDFDINLVAVICMLLFTCQSRIKSPIVVDKIARKLLENFKSLHEPRYLHMMMKMFRYSNYININFYKKLGDILVASNYLKKCKTQSQVTHIAFAYAGVRVTHPQLFHRILVEFQKASDHQRLKDIAKTIWACGTLVTNQTENISCIHDIVLHLKKNISMKKVREYPDNFIEILMGLAMLNIYPYDLINIVFDPVILNIVYDLPPDREKFYQLMFLDNSLSIECPDYSGFRLSEADRATAAKKMTDTCLDMDMQLRKSVQPAVTALSSVLNPDHVECTFVLPHCQTTDILLAYDMSKHHFVKPVTKPLGSYRNTTDRNTPGKDYDQSLQQLVLLLMSRTQTSYDGQPLGLLHCKIRQLKAMGYLVITIDAEEALSYVCLDMETTQRMLLGHISAALGTDVRRSLNTLRESRGK